MRLPPSRPDERPTTIPSEFRDGPEPLARPSILRLGKLPGGPHRCAHDLDMCAASAEIMSERFEHLVLGRVRAAEQQRLGADDHAVEAIAALRGLFIDKGV